MASWVIPLQTVKLAIEDFVLIKSWSNFFKLCFVLWPLLHLLLDLESYEFFNHIRFAVICSVMTRNWNLFFPIFYSLSLGKSWSIEFNALWRCSRFYLLSIYTMSFEFHVYITRICLWKFELTCLDLYLSIFFFTGNTKGWQIGEKRAIVKLPSVATLMARASASKKF